MTEKKPPLPKAMYDELSEASDALAKAQAHRDRLIVEALKAGHSTREVGYAARLSHGRVRQIGEQNGWPDEAERARRLAEKAERAEWRREYGGSW